MSTTSHTIGIVISSVFLVLSSHSASTDPPQYVLKSPDLQVVIDLRTGSIAQFHDLHGPDSSSIFEPGDYVLAIAAGEFDPDAFSVLACDSTTITIASSGLQRGTEHIPLHTTIRYQLDGKRLGVSYRFDACGRFELDKGLSINVSSSSWDTLLIRNHFSGEDPVVIGETNPVRHFALNQIFELRNAERNLTVVFPNPYESLVKVSTTLPHSFRFRWHVLTATIPFGSADMHGPPLASVLTPGVQLHRQLELIVTHGNEEYQKPLKPIAYFSPFPNGYDQVIAMTFDDIPFICWRYPKASRDPDAPMQQYLIRLLEDHPKMKMGWLILPDKILDEYDLATPDYPPGKWWHAHGKYRILTDAPEDYRQWIRNIDRDSLVYGYEDRVHLGSHGYHHTPEMEFGTNYEFQYYDPIFNDSTFSTIVQEYRLLGLGEKSHRWIRFPGFHFSRATVDALIRYGFVFFDYWGIYDKIQWLLFYSEHGRIWGAGTWWQGDRPSTYEDMDMILREGKLCHTCGHPPYWFDGYPEAAYQQIHQIFEQAERNYPNLGYLFPDEIGYFADETYDIRDIETDVTCNAFVLWFSGSATQGQTIVLEWPENIPQPTAATVDGLQVPRVEARGKRLVVILPVLESGPHIVRLSAALCDSCSTDVPPCNLVLYQNYPNPFNAGTDITYDLPQTSHVNLTIYDLLGKQVTVLVAAEQARGIYTVHWNGEDSTGKKAASGIYFCRLRAGKLRRARKLALVR